MYGVESCKLVFLGGHFLFTCSDAFAVWFSHNTLRHSQTDGQTDDIMIHNVVCLSVSLAVTKCIADK